MRRLGFAMLLAWAVLIVGATAASAAPDGGGANSDASAAKVRKSTRLVVAVTGLPKGSRPVGKVTGPGLAKRLGGRRLTIRDARPGRYTVTLRKAKVRRRARSIQRGATAYPARKRFRVTVRRGRRAVLAAEYSTIVNPGVTRAPSGLLAVIGDPTSPQQLVYANRKRLPRRGAIFTAAPSRLLPAGLVVKVTASKRKGARRVLSVKSIPVTAAVPEFEFDGALHLKPAAGGVTATSRAAPRARTARGCDGPSEFDIGARLDEFTLRHASAKAYPPQMSFTVAARTTEWIGPKLALAGVSCAWRITELGPWHGGIPTPVGVIPVYATIPVDAAVSVEGSLSAFKLNVASTSVLDVELGRRNRVGFRQEGTNVWVDGVLRFSGTASASATLTLQMGVGSPKVGDFHVKAGFGPKATWTAGSGCNLAFDLGTLSAGAKIGPFRPGTPSYTPFSIPLWRGCDKGSAHSVAPAVNFDGGPGTGPPPAALGPYAMTAFPADARDVPLDVSDVQGPTGPVAFSAPLTHQRVAEGWQTWSHGYTGDVYSTDGNEVTLTMPPNTGAAYFYAEPDVYDTFTVSATSQDGTSSGPVAVEGLGGARYFGFYATCGATLQTVRVDVDAAAAGFAVGELGIAPIPGGSSPCP